ncbi:conserved hypothetical protein [Luminiphilus syltensis NOR5-1B]|uniref:Choice-of-anchor D domain-containing protein n=1 Tax=Luminiphilus syltensis NOR5-1B TaxID=565045 RepID=B8KVM2_9GAMM|nr:choice-of-anchor D domain-containing protein [Luminiphilus syltensis]EED36388.1 conserved hypothetical protein [Luminiphilus syltensis NOR5-1B]
MICPWSLSTGAVSLQYPKARRILAVAFATAVGFMTLPAHAVDCPGNNYTLESQTDVNNFPAGCDRVPRQLSINENPTLGDPITSLAPLSELTSVGRDLLLRDTTSLASAEGLHNIGSIGRNLLVRNNAVLADLDDLLSIATIGGYLDIRDNAALVDVDGLASLTSLTSYLRIEDNAVLQNLDGLAGLTALPGGYLRIRDNPALTSIAGLKNITAIDRYAYIFNNDALTDLTGLDAVTSIGGNVTIQNNNALTSIAALGNLTTVTRTVLIRNNNRLLTLAGLEGLSAIPRALVVRDNNRLTDISALGGIATVGQNLQLINNRALPDLTGLDAITSIGGSLELVNGAALTDVSALAQLVSVGGRLRIQNNDLLQRLDGFGGLVQVDGDVLVLFNDQLDTCDALVPLLDAIDDDPAGPGVAPTPDVGGTTIDIRRNGDTTCNSIGGILGSVTPPAFALDFAPSTIRIGSGVTTSTLTYRIENGAARALGVGFDNTLPTGLRIATPSNATTDCPVAVLTAPDGGLQVTLSGVRLAASASCRVMVDIIGDAAGVYNTTTGAIAFTLPNGSVGSGANATGTLTVVAPALTLSPATLNFGNVLVGQVAGPQAVTVSNSGTGALNVADIDSAVAPMARSGGSCAASPFTLNPGANCTLEYTFSPGIAGLATQSIAIASDAPSSPDSIALAGTGIQPALTIVPGSTIDFGEVLLGQTGALETVTLRNSGTAVLTVSAIDAATAPLARTGGSCATSSFTLNPGESCTLVYSFSPTAESVVNQSIGVVSDAPGSPDSIDFTGEGIVSGLSVSPEGIDFDKVLVGDSSAAQTVTLTSSGKASVTVSSIDTPTAPMSLSGGSCVAPPFTLKPDESCTLEFSFSPSATGVVNQDIEIASDAPNSPEIITLAGEGVEPSLLLTPGAIDFGDVRVGESAGPLAVTVGNNGTAPLTVSAVDDAAAPLAQTGGSCTAPPYTLQPGDDCTLEYSFSPGSTGIINQSIKVSSDTASSPDSFDLVGNGVEAGIFLTPDSIDFGQVLVGETPAAQTVTVNASGTAALNVSAITAVAAPLSQTGGSCPEPPFTLDTGDSCTLQYSFSPTVTGAVNQNIEIDSDAPSSPDSIALAGVGSRLFRSFDGPLPSGSIGTIAFTTADAGCEFARDPDFLSVATPAPPSNIELIDGVVGFEITGCQPGATVDVTVDYGTPLPPGTQYWKAGNPWRQVAASVTGSTVSYSMTDGGPLDEDGAVNGVIVDPSGAAQSAGGGSGTPRAIPSLQPRQLIVLGLLLMAIGLRVQRRSTARKCG